MEVATYVWSDGGSRIHDLTHPLVDGAEAGFGLPSVAIRLWQPVPDRGWWATDIRVSSHVGTHMDAPRHWLEGGATVDQIDLSSLIGPAVALDLTHCFETRCITVDDLEGAAATPSPSRWLLATGWDRTFGTPDYLSGYPALAAEAATWLVDRGVRLLGVDMPSLGGAANPATHRVLLSAGVVIVEGMRGLEALIRRRFTLYVLPLRLGGADGAPVRAVAVEMD